MRTSLVFPPFYLGSLYNLPPLGLINLATVLRQAGHDPVVHDQVLQLRQGELPANDTIYEACARRVLADRPELVGISAQCATYPPTLRLARAIKRTAPDVPVAVGGHNASLAATATLERHPQVDMVLRGEGETAFPELLDVLERGRDLSRVDGLTWRAPDGSVRANPERDLIPDLDALPHPDYSVVPPLAEYKRACGLDRSIAILEVGRGCPHQCVYCSESVLWRRKTRTFSPARLVREMRHLADAAGAESFLMAYDQFTARRGFVEEFCQLVLDEGLEEIPWHGISRLDTVDEDLLALMKRAGCGSLCYGADSGSERTLAYIRKRIDKDLLLQRVRQTTAQDITPTLSFIVGFPEEQPEDVDATLELALQCAVTGDVNPLVQLPTVLPGAELHKRTRGQLSRVVDTYFALGLEYDGRARLPEDEALIDSDPELFSSFYNPPCAGFDLRELDRVAQMLPLVLETFPKTMLLLASALGEGASSLVLDLLDRPQTPNASFADRFRAWALDRFQDARGFGHLPEVLEYETCALEAARTGREFKAPPEAGGPRRRSSLVVREFAVDMDQVVADLRAGSVREAYPPEPGCLVFLHGRDGLRVSAVNAFGRDMLELCTGKNSATAIANTLFRTYGDHMAPEAFDSACREALDQLAGLGFVQPGREPGEFAPQEPQTGGNPSCCK